jgi:hypothetical protein
MSDTFLNICRARCLTFSCRIIIYLDFKKGNAEIELTIFTKRFSNKIFTGIVVWWMVWKIYEKEHAAYYAKANR